MSPGKPVLDVLSQPCRRNRPPRVAPSSRPKVVPWVTLLVALPLQAPQRCRPTRWPRKSACWWWAWARCLALPDPRAPSQGTGGSVRTPLGSRDLARRTPRPCRASCLGRSTATSASSRCYRFSADGGRGPGGSGECARCLRSAPCAHPSQTHECRTPPRLRPSSDCDSAQVTTRAHASRTRSARACMSRKVKRRITGRDDAHISWSKRTSKAQGLFRTSTRRNRRTLRPLELDLSTVEPSLAGPSGHRIACRFGNHGSKFRAAPSTACD